MKWLSLFLLVCSCASQGTNRCYIISQSTQEEFQVIEEEAEEELNILD